MSHEVLVRPNEDRVIALGPAEGEGWEKVLEPVAQVVRALLELKSDTPIAQKVFALSPESQQRLTTDRKCMVDGYFRGTLIDDRGKFSHQLQLREVDQAIASMPAASLVMAAQLAALQAAIEGLRDLMEAVWVDVRAILEFLQMEQRADIEAAVDSILHIYEDARSRGWVGEVDWSRISGMELLLRKQISHIEQELRSIRDEMTFNGILKNDFEITKRIDLERVADLFQLGRVLEEALMKHAFLQFQHKDEVNEFDDPAAMNLIADLAKSRERLQHLAQAIRAAVANAPSVSGRSWYEKLLSNGLVWGGIEDERRIRSIRSFQESVTNTVSLKHAAVLPLPRNTLQIAAP